MVSPMTFQIKHRYNNRPYAECVPGHDSTSCELHCGLVIAVRKLRDYGRAPTAKNLSRVCTGHCGKKALKQAVFEICVVFSFRGRGGALEGCTVSLEGTVWDNR